MNRMITKGRLKSQQKPYLFIIAGPNGAEKTTLAPVLLRDAFDLTEYVNADPIAQGLSGFHPESVDFEAGRIMLKRVHALAERLTSFAFETTLATRSYVRWIRKIKQRGYTVHLLFLSLRTPEVAVQRVKERVRLGGHDVEEKVIVRRFSRGLKNFFQLYMQLSNTWGFYDNSDSGEPGLIALGRGKRPTRIFHRSNWEAFKEYSD